MNSFHAQKCELVGVPFNMQRYSNFSKPCVKLFKSNLTGKWKFTSFTEKFKGYEKGTFD